MRVLHTLRSLRVNGITHVVLRTAAALDPARVRSYVCAMHDDDHLEPAFRAIGVQPIFLHHRGPGSIVSSVSRLVSIIRDLDIDVVHSNHALGHVMAGAAARLCGVPAVATLHWMAERSGDDTTAPRGAAGLRDRVVRSGRHTARIFSDQLLTDRIIAVSEAVARSHTEVLGRWFPASRVEVVYPGLDFDDITRLSNDEIAALRHEIGVADASHVLLNIGRLDPVKSQADLLPMMELVRQRYPSAVLLIAGDGQLREELQAEIERRQLSRTVLMLGWRLDTGALLSVSDVLVVPSRTEALSLPLLEAARQSRPVVATRVGGIPEVIDEGVTGYAVPPGDPPSLAAAVLRILGEPGASQRMGVAARLRLAGSFGMKRSARRMERIYNELAAGVRRA